MNTQEQTKPGTVRVNSKGRAIISARVIRADGSVEELGVLSNRRIKVIPDFIKRLLSKKQHGNSIH